MAQAEVTDHADASEDDELAQGSESDMVAEEEEMMAEELANMECQWWGDAEKGDLAWYCYDKRTNEHRGDCADMGDGPMGQDGPCDNYCANDGLDENGNACE